MNFKVVIPARYGSTRLPGKVLLDLAGKPLLQHVYERARQSGAAEVLIATDDARIETAAKRFGATVVMTSAEHRSGTDRVAEAVAKAGEPEDALIVNLQGDEPLIPPAVVAQVARLLEGDREASMATLCERITEVRDLFDRNVVKVVTDVRGRALYFSRAPIPWDRSRFSGDGAGVWPTAQRYHRHLGIYAYRAGFLRAFARLPPCAIEQTEALEQLRALYHGARILVAEACAPAAVGVDTAEDLERLRRLVAKGP